MPDGISGKAALVTGAASGIGAATARWLDRQGIGRLHLVDRDAKGMAALDLSCPAERLEGDVTDPTFWRDIEDSVEQLDFAVINAGIAGGAPIVEQGFSEWRQILGVNLDGAFLTLATALRLIAKGDSGGSVVLLASVAGIKPTAGAAAYGCSKAAIAHLARVAAQEHAAEGIRVNAIAPGGVDTPIWETQEWFTGAVEAFGSRAATMDSMAKDSVPMGRFQSADEIAAQIGFLLSGASGTITGTVLVSDGGYTL